MSILPASRGRPHPPAVRRGGRVVDGARLESVFTGNRNEGSNPSLSATQSQLNGSPDAGSGNPAEIPGVLLPNPEF